MEKNEIKKALYKEKPTAIIEDKETGFVVYSTFIKDHHSPIYFKVPYSEMGETTFEAEMPAQLLIRWII